MLEQETGLETSKKETKERTFQEGLSQETKRRTTCLFRQSDSRATDMCEVTKTLMGSLLSRFTSLLVSSESNSLFPIVAAVAGLCSTCLVSIGCIQGVWIRNLFGHRVPNPIKLYAHC